MFFSWFDQNKSFRKGGNLAGQVTPFLIIILVILLVAAVVTINIGRVSLDKTCSANAADAGSLAAASAWAGALNSLTKTNEEVLQTSYDYNYYAYGQLYNQAEGYIDEAIILCVVAAPLSLGALYAMNPPCTEDTIWVGGIIGAVLDAAASYMLFEAAMGVAAFNVTVSYMQSITDSFHEQQWRNYCDARDFMDESWINANEIGLNYAFSNSCIQGKLSNAQGDAYNAWVSGKGPYKDKTYSWQDNYSPPQEHTVSATLDLPDIVSYQLQHTVGSYSQINNLLGDLIDRSQIISGVLNSVASMLAATAAFAMLGFIFSIIYVALIACCYCPYPVCCPAHIAFAILYCDFASLAVFTQSTLVAYLEMIVAVAGAVSIYLLRDDLDESFDDWAPDGIQTSTSCADVSNLLIVKIDGVTLASGNRWNAFLCTTQDHGPGASAGVFSTTYTPTTSCSRAKFDGGDLGNFIDTYDPGIIGAN